MELGLEGGSLCDELVESDANSPHIDSFIVTAAMEHFRGPVVGGSRDGKHTFFVASFGYFLADAKINELDSLLHFVIQDVFWFDVAVADPVFMDIGHCGDQLEQYDLYFVFLQVSEAEEVGHVEIVHNQEARMLLEIQVHGLVLDDVGMVQFPDRSEVLL